MARELAGSNRLTLTENKRSDQILYDFYTGLSTRPLVDVLHEARLMFPVTDEAPDTTLVISHARRRFLNCKANLKRKPEVGAVFLRAPQTGKDGTGPQSMWVWPGLRVIGAGGQMKKGVFAKIESVCEDGDVVLDNGIALSASHACRPMRLAYAMTCPGAQGLTLQGRVRLDCTGSHTLPLDISTSVVAEPLHTIS